MQVAVFIDQDSDYPSGQLLVLPAGSMATSPLVKTWRFYGMLDSQSTLFDGVAVELHLQARGFALVKPKTLCVWS